MNTTDLMINTRYDINCELLLDTSGLITDIQTLGLIKPSNGTVTISKGRKIGIMH